MRTAVVLALVFFSRIASARAQLPEEGPRNAITTSLVAPLDRGFVLSYERAVAGSRLSVVSHLGMRFPALDDDFRTRGYGLGAELRYYAIGRAPGPRLGRRTIVGFFLFLRQGYSLTSIRPEEGGQVLGRGHRVRTDLGLGYRFMLGRHVELTPTLAFSMRTDVVPRLASSMRFTAVLGLSAGWLFERTQAED